MENLFRNKGISFLILNFLFRYEAEWSLARVLDQEVKNYRNIESLKDILSSSFDFNKLDLFNAVDDLRLGSLNISAVDEFLRN